MDYECRKANLTASIFQSETGGFDHPKLLLRFNNSLQPFTRKDLQDFTKSITITTKKGFFTHNNSFVSLENNQSAVIISNNDTNYDINNLKILAKKGDSNRYGNINLMLVSDEYNEF